MWLYMSMDTVEQYKMELLDLMDDLICAMTDQMRLREMCALFCTCRRLRDLSHKVEFWRRRAGVKHRMSLLLPTYPECRREVIRYHYDWEAVTYPLCQVDVWRDFQDDRKFLHDDTRYRVSGAILRTANSEQLSAVAIDDFNCQYLMAVGNPLLIEKCVKYIVSEPRTPRWIFSALYLTRGLRKMVRKTVINRMVGEDDLSNIPNLNLTGKAIHEVRQCLLQLLSMYSKIQFGVVDILYILRAIELIRSDRRRTSIVRQIPLENMYMYLLTGAIFRFYDYKVDWVCAHAVWCQSARQVKLF